MVRRRGDELDARSRVTHLGDPRRNLGARKMSAFARLGALGELDLQVGGVHQVVAGHAETCRCDLLDLAVAQRIIDAVFGFAAFTELERAPMVFMAIARVSCASWEMEP